MVCLIFRFKDWSLEVLIAFIVYIDTWWFIKQVDKLKWHYNTRFKVLPFQHEVRTHVEVWAHVDFYQTFKGELTAIFLELFQKIEEEGTFPNSFYETSITLILKPDENTPRKENCRPTSLINVVAKIITKILANWIQQHNKRIIHHNQVGFPWVAWVVQHIQMNKYDIPH